MVENKPKTFLKIWNTALDGSLPLYKALTKIKGIGVNFAKSMCRSLKINENGKAGLVSDSDASKIQTFIKKPEGLPSYYLNRQKDCESGNDEHLILSDLKLRFDNDVKRMMRTKSYKGSRHYNKLPVRGQRTRAHFRKGSSMGVKKPKKRGK